jgi:hypothetical protein
MFATIFFSVIIMIPIYGVLIWTYFYPEESMMYGRRWMYNEEPEISITAIRYTKFATMSAMIWLPIVIVSFILEIYILRLVLVLFPLVIIFGAIKIFTDNKE